MGPLGGIKICLKICLKKSKITKTVKNFTVIILIPRTPPLTT